jgi:hypothetical protein
MFRVASVLTAAAALTLLAGCQSQNGKMTADAMKPPPRPPELDKLQAFVGKWEDHGEGTAMGQTVKFSGTATMNWEVDGRVLLGRGEGTMGDMKMQSLEMWTWDPKAKKYMTVWMQNSGEVSHGTATYDEATRTWKMQGKGRNMNTGTATCGEGKIKMIDNNTMEWTFTEWDGWKTKKLFEGKGTSKRVPG